MSGVFDSNVFDSNVFLTGDALVIGGGYVTRYRVEEKKDYISLILAEKKQELKAVEQSLIDAERERQEAIRLQEKQASEAAAQEAAQLLLDINALRELRDALMRMIDDEEAIALLMLRRPFV